MHLLIRFHNFTVVLLFCLIIDVSATETEHEKPTLSYDNATKLIKQIEDNKYSIIHDDIDVLGEYIRTAEDKLFDYAEARDVQAGIPDDYCTIKNKIINSRLVHLEIDLLLHNIVNGNKNDDADFKSKSLEQQINLLKKEKVANEKCQQILLRHNTIIEMMNLQIRLLKNERNMLIERAHRLRMDKLESHRFDVRFGQAETEALKALARPGKVSEYQGAVK